MSLTKALKDALGDSVKLGSDLAKFQGERTWYSTGSFSLDKAIHPSGRGIPGGNLVEFFGDPSSGKSLLALYVLASAQAQGGTGVLINTEGALEASLAKQVNLNLDDLFIVESMTSKKKEILPVYLSDVFHIIEDIQEKVQKIHGKDHPLVIVWDSLPATNTKKDFGGGASREGSKEYNPIPDQGLKAKNLRQWLHRLTPQIGGTNTLLIMINHVVAKIASNPHVHYAKSKVAPGGSGPKFNSHIRLEFTKTGAKSSFIFEKGKEKFAPIGETLHVTVEKNRISAPYQKADIDFYFKREGGVQIDYYSGYLERLIALDIVENKGGWFSFKDEEGKEHKFRKADFSKTMEEYPFLREF